MALVETFDLSEPSHPVIGKVAAANLDYTWDWSDYCTVLGENIQTFTVTASSAMTVTNVTRSGNSVKAFIADGTVGKEEWATCRVAFASGRIEYKTIYFRVRAR